MKSGSLCALLWRILSWCTRQHITLRADNPRLAERDSRQAIQTWPDHSEWSLHPEVFQAVCSRWHQPQVDLFATRFNNKLPQFVSPVPDPQAWAVDALSLSWEDLDPYAFPRAAILGKVVEKLQDYPCNRIIFVFTEVRLIAAAGLWSPLNNFLVFQFFFLLIFLKNYRGGKNFWNTLRRP